MNEPAIALRSANENDQIALRGVRIAARIAGLSVRTLIEQTFVNLESKAIEAVYTFALPEGGAVAGFEVVFFDRVFTGVIDETDRALEKYDDAIAAGHGAYLLEQNRPDVFTVRVGNLKPNQAVTIRLTYVEDLKIVDRAIRHAFPTTIAPRYVSAAGTDPVDVMIDGEMLNPPHVLDVPYGLHLELEVDLDEPLKSISSPTHAITAAPASDGGQKIALAGEWAEMNRDVVINVELKREQSPRAVCVKGRDGGSYLAVTFVPEFDEHELGENSAAGETVFVLDCSGSMQGESIKQAVAALNCCLRAMSNGDLFNICRFGSTFEMLSPEPLKYEAHAMASAIAFMRRGADLGGTELLQPLEAIMANKPAGAGVRNIVLLTDGQVSNEPAIIALAKRKRSRNRFFTFGIGSASSQFLVKGLARVTSGAAEFIAPAERIEDKVLRTFGRIASPGVSDVSVEFGGAEVEAAPQNVPALFDGDALRLYARLGGAAPAFVTLNCMTRAGAKSWRVSVNEGRDPAGVLPTLWARAMIQSLEETGTESAAQKSRLIGLSKRYGLVSSVTSFIAVEHRCLEDRNNGRPELRRVPVQIAAGWHGMEGAAGSGTGLSRMMAMPSPMAAAAPMQMDALSEQAPAKPRGLFKRLRDAIGGGKESESTAPPARADGDLADVPFALRKVSRPDDELFAILQTQDADGHFQRSKEQFARGGAADLGLDLIRKTTLGITGRKIKDIRILHTLLVLSELKRRFADRAAIWKRAASKAMDRVAIDLKVDRKQVTDWLAQIN